MNSVSTFIFDCFGVICHPAVHGWYEENRLRQGYSDEHLPAILEQFDLGKLSEDELVDYFLTYEGINSTKEKIREEIDSHLGLDTELASTIKKLKESGFKTALLSNGNESFFERKVYQEYPQFKDLFDEIVISSSVGMVKPNADIYLHTLQIVGSRPEESLFIDDRKVNVDAATMLGMNGYVYTTSSAFSDYLKDVGVSLGR
ncbi:MAG: HAD family phosphatase [Patescibacteria group bacterium]